MGEIGVVRENAASSPTGLRRPDCGGWMGELYRGWRVVENSIFASGLGYRRLDVKE